MVIRGRIQNGVVVFDADSSVPEGTEVTVVVPSAPEATGEPALDAERLQLARAGILHLSPIVGQLVELWKGPEADDYGRLQPTQYAFDKVIQLLVDAAIVTYPNGHQIPGGSVSTDSEGGVRIEWIRDSARVHLVVPATDQKAAYVYHEVGKDYATEDVTAERLSYWLRAVS